MRVLIGSLLVLIITVVGYVAFIRVAYFQWDFPNLFKIVDPSDPRYNPEDFHIANYDDDGDKIRKAFAVTFPVGTPKAIVDKIMKKSKCFPGANKTYNWMVYYYCPPEFHPIAPFILSGTRHYKHLFVYDEHKNLLNIHPRGGGEKVFSNSLDKTDMR